jgi:hypothetical protein
VVASLGWIAAITWGLFSLSRVRVLRDQQPAEPSEWPRLSVILSARNEEGTIDAALGSLRAQDYPSLEIIAVDDRSEDDTGSRIERAASEDPRIVPVHVRRLPAGWLGKVHALSRAEKVATGEWLLFTDADVHFGPGVLRRAVAVATERRLDHLVVAPDVRSRSRLQEAASTAFAAAFLLGTRALDVSREGSEAYVGVGGFNLVRRTTWSRTPGFAWIRMEILDDVGLARMLRDVGARRDFILGLGDLSVVWYGSLGEMVAGLEKNFFSAVARFSAIRAVAIVCGIVALALGPAVGIALGLAWVRLLSAGAVLGHVSASALLGARMKRSLVPLVLMPVGGLVLAYALGRSTWRCLRRGGVTWRGTFYSLADLRRGRRIDL